MRGQKGGEERRTETEIEVEIEITQQCEGPGGWEVIRHSTAQVGEFFDRTRMTNRCR